LKPPEHPRRPLLKWAGGKRQLLPVFQHFYPERVSGYVEPFVGSAAVFFDLLARGALGDAPVTLADTNTDLIGTYAAVRDAPGEVIETLERLDRRHAREGARCYYDVRERFNAARRAPNRPAAASGYSRELAAMLIYLNRTGYNGLFRVNAGGAFNVPAGRYARPHICDPGLVRAVGAAFARDGLRLQCAEFDQVLGQANAGDFVYLDPPYAPLSTTSAFGAYTADRFSASDQVRLCDAVVDLARRSRQILLSNSSAPEIVSLYRQATRAGGGASLRLWSLSARRAINSRATGRGVVTEVLLTNLEPRGMPDGLAEIV
jgi:DNA adenine methylase